MILQTTPFPAHFGQAKAVISRRLGGHDGGMALDRDELGPADHRGTRLMPEAQQSRSFHQHSRLAVARRITVIVRRPFRIYRRGLVAGLDDYVCDVLKHLYERFVSEAEDERHHIERQVVNLDGAFAAKIQQDEIYEGADGTGDCSEYRTAVMPVIIARIP